MTNLLFILDAISSADDLCNGLKPILRLLGYAILMIKIAVPILLIFVGMLDLAKAVTENKEDKIKEAQNLLIKKAIAAVAVFLVATIVTILMRLVGNNHYQVCMQCIYKPSSCNVSSY